MQGFGVSAKAETCIFTVSQALFSSKIAAKCKETTFFSLGRCCSRSNFGVSGRAPEGLRSSMLSCVGLFLSLSGPFLGSKMGLQSRLGNRPKQAPRTPGARPQETPQPTLYQKRPQNKHKSAAFLEPFWALGPRRGTEPRSLEAPEPAS